MSVDTVENEIRKVLERSDVKPAVHGYDIVYGRDSTDDDAVWVYVTLAKDPTDWATRSKIRELLQDTIGDDETTGVSWVHVRFRTAGEIEEE